MLGLGLSISKINLLADEALNALLAAVKARSANYENQDGTITIIDELSADGLLDSASILVTPTAYSDGRLHSLKTYTGADIFDINDSSVQDGNWVINTGSNTFTKAASGSSSGYVRLKQPSHSGMEIGGAYLVTITASGLGSGVNGLRFYNNDGAVGDIVETDGTHSQVVKVTGSGGARLNVGSNTQDITISNVSIVDVSSDFTVTSDTDATRINENGIIEDIAANQPRINYEPSASGAVANSGHILLERASTNIMTYSGSLVGFGGAASPATDNTISNPEGQSGALRVSNLQGGAGDRLNKNVTITPSETYTGSIYYKGDGSNIGKTISFYIKRQSGSDSFSSIEKVTLTSEWQRVEMTNTFLADNTLAGIFVYNNNDNATEVLLWGAQMEELPSATSYIPTTSNPVTRARDTFLSAGNFTLCNSTQGTLYCEIKTFPSRTSSIHIGVNGDVAGAGGKRWKNACFIGVQNNNHVFGQCKEGDSGSTIFSRIASGTDATAGYIKCALKWKSDDIAFFVSGSKIGLTETSPASFYGADEFDQCDFSRGGNSFHFEGKVKAVAVYTTALSDSDMITLTS